ncbi:MAG TPA: hypothetical protein VLM11_22685 [Streptosporangiaceae bacterium]|nr:hypothetical protein [Streptosporangiaceae bacterium]
MTYDGLYVKASDRADDEGKGFGYLVVCYGTMHMTGRARFAR